MSRASGFDEPALIECPSCGLVGEAEPIQLHGRCSLICPSCGYHFYITPKVDGVATVWEGKRVRVVGEP